MAIVYKNQNILPKEQHSLGKAFVHTKFLTRKAERKCDSMEGGPSPREQKKRNRIKRN